MAVNLAALITSFVIAFLFLPVIIKYSLKKKLVDVPGRRKIHKKEMPSMGGVAIFLGFFISSLIWINLSSWSGVKFILVPFVIIFITGLRDDLVPLNPFIKLGGQAVAAAFLVFLFGLRLDSFYGLWSLQWHPYLSYGFSVFSIVIVVNSFNLIDGIDGLAGSVALVALIAFGVWFFLTGDTIFSVFCFAMMGGVGAFLFFNWEESEIFMGDTGAMVIGLLLAVISIYFINANEKMGPGSPYHFTPSVTAATACLIVPLFDTLRIIILRVWKKQSVFKADKNHIHHVLVRLGLSHASTTIILAGFQGLCILACVLLNDIPDRIMFPSMVGVCILLSIILDRLILSKLSARTDHGAQ